MLSTLSKMPKESGFSQITNQHGEKGLAGVIGSKLVPLGRGTFCGKTSKTFCGNLMKDG